MNLSEVGLPMNLLELNNYVLQAINKNIQVDVNYTDFSKAFGCVNHTRLFDKIWNFGITGSTFDRHTSFLLNLTQSVGKMILYQIKLMYPRAYRRVVG